MSANITCLDYYKSLVSFERRTKFITNCENGCTLVPIRYYLRNAVLDHGTCENGGGPTLGSLAQAQTTSSMVKLLDFQQPVKKMKG